VGPRAGLDNVEERKFLTLTGLKLQPVGCQPTASRYTDCAIPAPLILQHIWMKTCNALGFAIASEYTCGGSSATIGYIRLGSSTE
jgi:hypothetical protein